MSVELNSVILVELTVEDESGITDVSEYNISANGAAMALVIMLATGTKIMTHAIVEHGENFYHVVYITPADYPPAIVHITLHETVTGWIDEFPESAHNCMMDDSNMGNLSPNFPF